MSFRIHLSPSGASFLAEPEETLLAAAQRAGHKLPWGCGVGACRTCAARLLSGHARMPPGTALTPAQLEEGLVLLCVAKAASSLELEVGKHQGLLPPLPWTD